MASRYKIRVDARDGIKGVGGLAFDITESKRAEEALRQQAEALRASHTELAHFNRAMVGRELRMIELEKEINELGRRLVEPPRHASIAEESET